MALLECQECGGQVSSTAGACPHCGYREPAPVWAPEPVHHQRPGMPGWLKAALFVLLGGFVLVGAAVFGARAMTGAAVSSALTEAGIKTAQHQMSELDDAINAYYLVAEYPRQLPRDLDALVAHGRLSELPKDPWGNDYIYSYPTRDEREYDLRSAGPDGKAGTDDDVLYEHSSNHFSSEVKKNGNY